MDLEEVEELRKLSESLDMRQLSHDVEDEFFKPKSKSGGEQSENIRIDLERQRREDEFLHRR